MSPRKVFLPLFVCLVGVAYSAPSSADVIYNNGSPLLAPAIAQGAMFADPGNPGFSEAADDFALPVGMNVIRDIHWWGTYGATPSDDFTINIYDNNAGTVGTLNTAVNIVSLNRTNTGLTINGRAMYLYDAVVSDIALTPSTTYWLGISNDTGASGSSGWAWVIAANSGNSRQYSTTNAAWGNSNNKTLAFNLTNTIPEPSTYVLAGVGLAALAIVRRRVRSK